MTMNVLPRLMKKDRGQVLALVLAVLATGALIIPPSMSFVSTSLRTGRVINENVQALYSADSGIEDAIWRALNDPPRNLPYSYRLGGNGNPTIINGMTVDVLMDYVEYIDGIPTGEIRPHSDWLQITKEVNYDNTAQNYIYTLTLTNRTTSVIKIEQVVVSLPPGLDYVAGPVGGSLTTDDPVISGVPQAGITLTWAFENPGISIEPGPNPKKGLFNFKSITFRIRGTANPEGIYALSGIAGFVAVTAIRQDVGTVSDLFAYKITSTARNAQGSTQAIITAGIWESGSVWIRHWKAQR
ncbi:MAG: hypothetical protein HYX87_07315 [Chloroflexi bacterium]|nr:hypothetical protein [Chloroflexota bacterium]